MKEFDPSEAASVTEKLIVKLQAALAETTNKILKKQHGYSNDQIIPAIQSIGINYLLGNTRYCIDHIAGMTEALDYLEVIRENINTSLDLIKIEIKSVSLN